MEALAALSLLMVFAFVIALALKKLGQPMLIAYILAGIAGSLMVSMPHGYMELMSTIGVSFLLFIVGMHLSPKSMKSAGRPAIVASLAQMLGTFAVSYAILSMVTRHALILAIASSFSSTIIAMKILSDRNEIDSLHGRIAIAILIMQDVAAMFALMFVGAGYSGPLSIMLDTAAVALISAVLWVLVSKIDRFMARSHELLFIFSIAWLFSITLIFSAFGFSPEMGSLIAGMLLSNSAYRFEISSRIKPLRDFFIIMFFIAVGYSISSSTASVVVVGMLVLASIIIKPAITYISLRLHGYLPRVAFMSSISISQLSEFSIILASTAMSSGLLLNSELSAVSMATVITMAITPYLMNSSRAIWKSIKPGKPAKIKKKYDAILFGCNRIGHIILKSLSGKVLVVDFNPDVVESIKGVDTIYGDASDEEFLEAIGIDRAKLIISTIPDYETNLLVLSKASKQALKIVVSYDIEEAMEFYSRGASLVLLPHFLGGEYVASVIEKNGFDISKYEEVRKKHIRMLKEKKRLGHVHPSRYRS